MLQQPSGILDMGDLAGLVADDLPLHGLGLGDMDVDLDIGRRDVVVAVDLGLVAARVGGLRAQAEQPIVGSGLVTADRRPAERAVRVVLDRGGFGYGERLPVTGGAFLVTIAVIGEELIVS